MSRTNIILITILSTYTLCGCMYVIRQGEVGVKRTLGVVSKKTHLSGVKFVNPFTSIIVRIPIQTQNLKVSLELPTKEGMTIEADISILYHVEPKDAPLVFEQIGLGYEEGVILPVFRSIVTDVSAHFYAKDLYIGKGRSEIEKSVKERITDFLQPRGFNVEAVLLKSIRLPRGLANAIETKLRAEQEAQQMEFILEREKKEAERKRVEAQGIRDANKIITEGLSPLMLQYSYIDALKKMADSNNSKFIITDGKTPFIFSGENR